MIQYESIAMIELPDICQDPQAERYIATDLFDFWPQIE
jgi:hypothetical protein